MAVHRYRKIECRMWTDAKVRRLSRPQPCGQSLWVWLLTNPGTTNVPGLFCAGEAAIAEALGWTLEGFRKAWAEVFAEGLAKADWDERVVWVPGVSKINPPENPNVIKSWRAAWDETPDCPLKAEAYRHLKGLAEGISEPFAKAFAEACRNPYPKGLANQEQEQEQEQEQTDLARAIPGTTEPGPEPPSAALASEPPADLPDRRAADSPMRGARPPDRFGARFAIDRAAYEAVVEAHPNPGTTHAEAEFVEAAREHFDGDQAALAAACILALGWQTARWKASGDAEGKPWQQFVTRLPKYLTGRGWAERPPPSATSPPTRKVRDLHAEMVAEERAARAARVPGRDPVAEVREARAAGLAIALAEARAAEGAQAALAGKP